MPVKSIDFLAFIEEMRGNRLLHLGHKDADCDALGSAFAMSRILPGDVGFSGSIKTSAGDLAQWLGLEALIDPDPATYDYTIIYDTLSPSLLNLPLPRRYALFDHHEPGGHRYGNFRNQLAAKAEYAWVQPVESTCSLLVDLFRDHGVVIDQKMAVALAAGIVTDTLWLQQANAGALSRLATVLEIADLFVEDIVAVVDGPRRRGARRPVVLEALRGLEEREVDGWSVLSAETNTHDNGFTVVDTLKQLGSDVAVVGFPKRDRAMVLVECSSEVVERVDLDMVALMKKVAQVVQAEEIWGTRALGRIIALTMVSKLMSLCIDVVAEALTTNRD